MYPTIFRIGTFDITSFGVLVAVGALVGLWLYGRELERSRLPQGAADAALAGVIGGLVGAKLLWAIEFADQGPFLSLLFSRGGLSWFGGFLGGVGTGIVMLRRHHIPIIPAVATATPSLALGHAIGRLGCFMVGDDYGRPSDLPWAVAFPKGLPPTTDRVHPTQLYEAAALLILAWLLLRWRRHGMPHRAVLGRYLVIAGAIRFAIEFVRINEPIAGPLTLAQLISLGVVIAGIAVVQRKFD